MAEPNDVQDLVNQLMAGASPAERKALLEGLLTGDVRSIFEKLERAEAPRLLPVPTAVRGFRLRLDLGGAKPPIWRRLELPGDLTLPRLHEVIQAAMGWSDSHLHQFRTGRDRRSAHFVTLFDIEEGDEGTLEDDVRLDQLLAQTGDELWYAYDFGDGWDHRLVVEEVLAVAPALPSCTGGRMACPPEDCGGIGGYEELVRWVRSGYDDVLLPAGFEDAEHGRSWLPLNWHPDRFELTETQAALATVVAEPVVVTAELAELAGQLERRGVRLLRDVLGRDPSHGPTDVTEAEATRLTETYRVFLDVIGDGVPLTNAGYLQPAVVEEFAARSGISGWWIGKANREDLTPPVAQVRDSVRALGLVSVRKGRLSPTAAAVRCREDPLALWRHIVGRLPLGTKDAQRHAGWMALAVVGSGAAPQEWHTEIGDLLLALGWHSRHDPYSAPPAGSPTLDVVELLAGAARARWRRIEAVDPAVAATARAAIQPR